MINMIKRFADKTFLMSPDSTDFLVICDESAASPLLIIVNPSGNCRPSPGSRREWACERGWPLKQPVWRRVMRHT